MESRKSLQPNTWLRFAEFVFKAKELDEKNWVVDFGSLKPIEAWLRTTFDHTTVVAEDDHRNLFEAMDDADIVDLRILPGVGCEMFAQLAFDFASDYIEMFTAIDASW